MFAAVGKVAPTAQSAWVIVKDLGFLGLYKVCML
jgi:hypothetical protein